MAERIRRTKEEIVAEYDRKIEYHQGMVAQLEERISALNAKMEKHQNAIERLESKKDATLNPKPRILPRRKNSMKTVMDRVKEMGMTAEQVADRLGISLD